ncbi:MAG: hypothetical protein IPQ27_09720 [Chitinophagaceae bacterium]|nr:hypothetical protein [Chitinophagaceae bacterium]
MAETHALQAEQDLIETKAARKSRRSANRIAGHTKTTHPIRKNGFPGELTAGIAHEIQNPLNLVNNFSEVSTELIDEMKEELAKGNEQLATEIADDLKQNLEK